MTGSCVFCSILAGNAAASVVWEDEEVAAFMDIRPVRPGQLLIVPRAHVDHFADLPDDLATKIFLIGQRVARALRATLQPLRVGMIVHGFGVAHAHLVVLPLAHPWDITAAQYARVENGRVHFHWEQVPLAPRPELDEMAERLALALSAA